MIYTFYRKIDNSEIADVNEWNYIDFFFFFFLITHQNDNI